MTEPEDREVCDLCGQRLDVVGPGAWVALEVFRPEADYINVEFCRQEHAVEWLTKPLPPVEPRTPLPRTVKDRLTDWSVGALFLGAAGLMLLGVYALVRLLGGWN